MGGSKSTQPMLNSSHDEEQAMVSIHSLRKIFPTTDGAEKVAVDDLNLSMKRNKITGLLGMLLTFISAWSVAFGCLYYISQREQSSQKNHVMTKCIIYRIRFAVNSNMTNLVVWCFQNVNNSPRSEKRIIWSQVVQIYDSFQWSHTRASHAQGLCLKYYPSCFFQKDILVLSKIWVLGYFLGHIVTTPAFKRTVERYWDVTVQ